jgi:glycine/D-amino acid oxidase-like deaminating enzyme
VLVAEDRIIRTVTGLRPYRPSGFVVKRETIGTKTLVHNYGHGGGGMTLSWGTSHLAVELAAPAPESNVAVLGCGGVGLATARLLQRQGAHVTIYAKALPPGTTSNIAGAQWMPTSVFDEGQATPEFREQFVRAARLSYREYQNLPGERYGIRWIRNYIVSDNPLHDQFILGPSSPMRDLYPEYADLPENATPFGRYARRFTTMMIEPPVYLNALLQDFQIAGGRVVVRGFESAGELQSLPEPLLINCTGLGAGALFSDKEIVPVKGQLTVLLPQADVNYNLLSGGVYMFPRRDGILLGGTWDRGNWDLAPDLEAQKRIVARHRELFARV